MRAEYKNREKHGNQYKKPGNQYQEPGNECPKPGNQCQKLGNIKTQEYFFSNS